MNREKNSLKNLYTLSRDVPFFINTHIQNLIKEGNDIRESIDHRDYHLGDNYKNNIDIILKKKQEYESFNKKGTVSKLLTKALINENNKDMYANIEPLNIHERWSLCMYYKFMSGENDVLEKLKHLKRKYFEEFVDHEFELLIKLGKNFSELNKRESELRENATMGFIKTNEKLLELDPIEFEHHVATFFEKKGYSANVTTASNDGGIDIILKDDSNRRYAVQCKRYSKTVSSSDMRTFLGTLVYNRIKKGFFVTTGNFSTNAIKIASEHNIELYDGERISKEFPAKEIKEEEKSINREIEEIDKIRRQQISHFYGVNIEPTYSFEKNLTRKISEYNTHLERLSPYDLYYHKLIRLHNLALKIVKSDFAELFITPFNFGGGATNEHIKLFRKHFSLPDIPSPYFLSNKYYEDTGARQIIWIANEEVINKWQASTLINFYLTNKSKKGYKSITELRDFSKMLRDTRPYLKYLEAF